MSKPALGYLAIPEPADNGSWSVWVSGLPGSKSCGDTPDEAMDNVEETIRCHIETPTLHGEPVPTQQ